jgi:hypothetical protein
MAARLHRKMPLGKPVALSLLTLDEVRPNSGLNDLVDG